MKYYDCSSCGCELVDTECDTLIYVSTNSSGDVYICPICTSQNLIYNQKE